MTRERHESTASALTRNVVLAAVSVVFLGFMYLWIGWAVDSRTLRMAIPVATAVALVGFWIFVRSPGLTWALIGALTLACLAFVGLVMWGLSQSD